MRCNYLYHTGFCILVKNITAVANSDAARFAKMAQTSVARAGALRLSYGTMKARLRLHPSLTCVLPSL